jgi:hypothetical protein
MTWLPHARRLSPRCAKCSTIGSGKRAPEANDGRWHVRIDLAPFGKTLPQDVPFGSIDEVQHFVGKYFGKKVIKVKPNDPEVRDEMAAPS